MSHLKAIIKRKIYKNISNDYAIFSAHFLDGDFKWNKNDITITGDIIDVKIGSTYQFKGTLFAHPKYGMQFNSKEYKFLVPEDRLSLIQYFSSNEFPGIGQKTAAKLVDNFGKNIFSIIKDKPSLFLKMGLKKRQLNTLKKVITKDIDKQKTLLLAKEYGIGNEIFQRLYEQFGPNFINDIKRNPFCFIGLINGYTFHLAELISYKIHFSDENLRFDGAIISCLNDDNKNNGNTYILKGDLRNKILNLLGSQFNKFFADLLDRRLNFLLKNKKIFILNKRISLFKNFQLERSVSNNLIRILKNKTLKIKYDKNYLEKSFLDRIQKKAIISAFKNKISILTGGPGTGKTTIIKILIKLLEEKFISKNSVLLAAPTGRAAARITEITGHKAMTIHRMLGADENGFFSFNDKHQLQADLIVIDEISMVDLNLFEHLLEAVPNKCHLLLVGDNDQLSSVGQGQVLLDLINSGLFNVTKLENNYRQDKGSDISIVSQDMKVGAVNRRMFERGRDISFFSMNKEQMAETIKKVLMYAIQAGIPKENIQIIAPTNRLVNTINYLARPFLIKNKNNIFKDKLISLEKIDHFLVGDRVMQQKNDSEKGINNGDIGYITQIKENKILKTKKVEANFFGRPVLYKDKEANQLCLGYASTVHKAQGSEFQVIIFVLMSSLGGFVTRNLIYTGITRAERSLVLLGNKKAFIQAINNPTPLRKTNINYFLYEDYQKNKKFFSEKKNAVTLDKIKKDKQKTINLKGRKDSSGQKVLTSFLIKNKIIDPLIGMKGIKPSDFKNE